jgi:hypothetical protein
MSHWAEINKSNVVLRVLVGSNEGDEGQSFFESLGGVWVKCSYNATIRKNYPGIGFKYDKTLDAFIPPKCHTEAILNESICQWTCGNEEHNVTIS